jgi:hypothetical protein
MTGSDNLIACMCFQWCIGHGFIYFGAIDHRDHWQIQARLTSNCQLTFRKTWTLYVPLAGRDKNDALDRKQMELECRTIVRVKLRIGRDNSVSTTSDSISENEACDIGSARKTVSWWRQRCSRVHLSAAAIYFHVSQMPRTQYKCTAVGQVSNMPGGKNEDCRHLRLTCQAAPVWFRCLEITSQPQINLK